MSKVTIQGDASGTGIFTIASPNSNTDRTLVLPDEAGTVLTTAGVPASAMPAGSVIQVVQGTTETVTSTSSTSYVSTALNASITPSSASSKIIILATSSFWHSQANYGGFFSLFRGDHTGTNLFSATGGGDWYGNNSIIRSPFSLHYVDSPSTTSSTTYTVCMKSESASFTVYSPVQSGAKGVIILMEIAA